MIGWFKNLIESCCHCLYAFFLQLIFLWIHPFEWLEFSSFYVNKQRLRVEHVNQLLFLKSQKANTSVCKKIFRSIYLWKNYIYIFRFWSKNFFVAFFVVSFSPFKKKWKPIQKRFLAISVKSELALEFIDIQIIWRVPNNTLLPRA